MTKIDDEMVERAFVKLGYGSAHNRQDLRRALEAALSPKPEPEIEVSEGMRMSGRELLVLTVKGRARRGPKDSDHRAWKLTDEQVAEIRTKKKSGTGYAKQFKISPRSVYNIWAGRTWR